MKRIKNYQSFLENILLIKNKEFLDKQEKDRQEKNKDKVTRGTVGFVSSDKSKFTGQKNIKSDLDDSQVQSEMDDTQTQGEMYDTQTQGEMGDIQGQSDMEDSQGQSDEEACGECEES